MSEEDEFQSEEFPAETGEDEAFEDDDLQVAEDDGDRLQGSVKWYNVNKGYGFVEGDDGQDYFVHYTQLPEAVILDEDDEVSFDAVETDKGWQAQNVQLEGDL
jgi:CspA family cold shock protein